MVERDLLNERASAKDDRSSSYAHEDTVVVFVERTPSLNRCPETGAQAVISFPKNLIACSDPQMRGHFLGLMSPYAKLERLVEISLSAGYDPVLEA